MTGRKWRFALLTLVCLLLASVPAQALISVGRGNAPVQDHNWRAGAVDVANLKSRVADWVGPSFGGGMWNFLYRGDTDAFNQALDVFAKVRAPSLELIVCDGPGESYVLGNGKDPKFVRMRDDKDPKSDSRYDWDFTIWDVGSYYQLYGNPKSAFLSEAPDFRRPLPPPRMHVYVGGGGAVEWDKVRVPAGIVVIDKRASAAGIKPGQGAVVAGNVFDMATSKPLADARITLERLKGEAEGKAIVTGQSDREGRFRIEKVPAGTYCVSASAQGYASLVVGYERLVTDGYLVFDDVELASEAKVSGSVTDDAGKPMAGATVRLADIIAMNGLSYRLVASAETTTDAEGRFEINGAPTGYGRVMCYTKGYHAPVGELRTVPAKDVAIRMSQTGAIRGRVIGGKPQGGNITVSVAPEGGEQIGKWGGGMHVEADGTFQFDNVPPGIYYISTGLFLFGQAPDAKARKITVIAGQTVEVELEPQR